MKLVASPRELVELIATVTGTPVSTVSTHDRNLVVAGLRSKAGRGTSAAKVTPRDGAVNLVAIMAAPAAKDSVVYVHRFMETRADLGGHLRLDGAREEKRSGYAGCGVEALEQLPEDHSFVDAVAALIEAAGHGQLDNFLYGGIRTEWPHTEANIHLSPPLKDSLPGRVVTVPYIPPEALANGQRRPAYGAALSRSCHIDLRPISYIGALLYGKLHELPPASHSGGALYG